jgi:hypothetical protein
MEINNHINVNSFAKKVLSILQPNNDYLPSKDAKKLTKMIEDYVQISVFEFQKYDAKGADAKVKLSQALLQEFRNGYNHAKEEEARNARIEKGTRKEQLTAEKKQEVKSMPQIKQITVDNVRILGFSRNLMLGTIFQNEPETSNQNYNAIKKIRNLFLELDLHKMTEADFCSKLSKIKKEAKKSLDTDIEKIINGVKEHSDFLKANNQENLILSGKKTAKKTPGEEKQKWWKPKPKSKN